MAIYIYNASTGALVSYCPTDDSPVASKADLDANGLVAIKGWLPLDDTHSWDATTKSVKVVAAPVVPNIVQTANWIMQFTDDEHDKISNSVDKKVKKFLFALTTTPTIDLNNFLIQGGLAYLVAINLLTQIRANTLGAWTEE